MHSFNLKIRHYLSSFFFKLYKLSKGNIEDHFTEKGIRYATDHELPSNVDYSSYKHQYSNYFKKWGLKVPMIVSEYCSRMSGIRSDTYLTRDLSFNYIYPYLVRYEFCPAYADKNIEARVLNIKKIQEKIDVLIPHTIVSNMNGIFFNDKEEEITAEQAAKILDQYNQDTVIKPSLGTYGGVGVVKLDHIIYDKSKYLKVFEDYKKDFLVQEIVKQHPDLASFNESSINTIRIVTYRKPNKERKVLYTIIRYGGKGMFKDNSSAGGGFSVINRDGTLKDRIIHIYRTSELKMLPESVVNKIPYFDRILDAALALHGQLPYFDIMGWDFALSPEGHPLLIEYNIRPGYGHQSGAGPMFSEEDLDEIMPHVMNHRKTFVAKPYVHYNEKWGFDSFWDV